MPTLQFKGKNIIWNHHLSIPYHTLDEVEKLHFQPDASAGSATGNLIIEGDNLLALKALLPQYTGKIKCIYIDPPYNTGNEGWVYNDNVNSPMIKDWLGKEVGSDCLVRHDKWLCMMVPRLKLLRDLLADDGVIFISIDDNELNNLSLLMEEVFGKENFIGVFVINSSPSGIDYGPMAKMHDYALYYAKNITNIDTKQLPEKEKSFKYEDEIGPFNLYPLYNGNVAFNPSTRPNLYYPFYLNPKQVTPDGFYEIGLEKKDGLIEVYPVVSKKDQIQRVWRWGKEKSKKNLNKEIVGYITEAGEYRVVQKTRHTGKVIRSLQLDTEISSRRGTAEVEILFKTKIFAFPKALELIKRFISVSTDENDIILDSFAGSGTTMHAVMDLNKEDGGNRKCILIQMTEASEAEPKKNICKDITRERVKRAIEKYDYDSGFQYLKVGIPIDAETLLSGNLPTYKQFAEYVYYLCTGESLKDKKSINEKSFFVGDTGNSIIYLVYKQNFEELTRMALNLTLAEKITADHPKKRIVVYAPACFLEEDYMTEKGIDYVGIPYNLFQRSEV